ncbi:MAG: hypothetical protein LZF60_340163 [Nitrospira sp.]|nr:MAG: hypothetical protein LZF60_340163 [Nitrospira sp.]
MSSPPELMLPPFLLLFLFETFKSVSAESLREIALLKSVSPGLDLLDIEQDQATALSLGHAPSRKTEPFPPSSDRSRRDTEPLRHFFDCDEIHISSLTSVPKSILDCPSRP